MLLEESLNPIRIRKTRFATLKPQSIVAKLLSKESDSFPLGNLSGIPITSTSTGEVIYLYFPDIEYNFLTIALKPEKRKVLRDTEILSKLKSSILFYSKKLFSQNDLEKRINISYNDENKNIETYLSFAIEMSEKFKKKRTIANRLNIFKEVRKEVMQSAVHNNNKKALRDIFQKIKINNQSKNLFGNLALEMKKMKEQEKSNSQESQNNNTSPNNSSPNQENNEFILSKISHQRGRDENIFHHMSSGPTNKPKKESENVFKSFADGLQNKSNTSSNLIDNIPLDVKKDSKQFLSKITEQPEESNPLDKLSKLAKPKNPFQALSTNDSMEDINSSPRKSKKSDEKTNPIQSLPGKTKNPFGFGTKKSDTRDLFSKMSGGLKEKAQSNLTETKEGITNKIVEAPKKMFNDVISEITLTVTEAPKRAFNSITSSQSGKAKDSQKNLLQSMGDGLKSARDSSKNLFSNMSQGLKDKASETKKMFNDLKSGIEEGPSGMIKSFTNSVGLRSSTKSLTHMVHNISNNRNQIDQTKLTLRDVVKLQGNDVEIGKHREPGVNYKEVLLNVFGNITDFRKDIIEYVIRKDKEFYQRRFDKFIFYLEFFITLFSGIQVKYYIDELGLLDLDFYATEKMLMNIAESFHYQVQFKILDIPIIRKSDQETYNREGKKVDRKLYFHQKEKFLKEINKLQYEDFNINLVENYPPFTTFIRELTSKFRRYDKYDNYHSCSECERTSDGKKPYSYTCSSCFRIIDKARLIYSTLSTLIDMNGLENSLDDSDDPFGNIFKSLFVLQNQTEIEKIFNIDTVTKGYVSPISIKETTIINKVYRNIFGEEVGFYYSWITHYIKWLLFPSVIGLTIHLCKFFFDTNSLLTLNLLFAAIVILWGSYYVEAWKEAENVYRYIWGMDSYKLEKNTDILKSNAKYIDIEEFMDVNIPVYDQMKQFLIHSFAMLIILLTLLFTIFANLLVFYIEKMNREGRDISNLFEGKKANQFAEYVIPMITYFVRECLSSFNNSIAVWLTDREINITKEEYNESLLKKQICFEFFNYYFNLYFIAFGKRYLDTCNYGDCYLELGNQLSIIILSNITVLITKFLYDILYKRKKMKKFEDTLKKKYKKNENSSKKLIYYTRNEYTEDRDSLILPIIFNFGYILQFGASSPISFFFVLVLTMILRITNGISMTHLFFMRNMNESQGIGIFNSIQGIIVFLGLFSNLCIIFYTNKQFISMEISKKLLYLVITENIVFVILKIGFYIQVPRWFPYKNRIEMKYLKKHGVRSKQVQKKETNN